MIARDLRGDRGAEADWIERWKRWRLHLFGGNEFR